MKIKFLDLGKQPIANKFLSNKKHICDEYMFELTVEFDDETKLVSLGEFVPPEMMFNDSYVYHSSLSQTMRQHFKTTAENLKSEFLPKTVLEIGSNDGVFLRHFETQHATAIEPCGNFAKITNDMGYYTVPGFLSHESIKKILDKNGKQDLVYSANCMCHIHDLNSAFSLIEEVLSPEGIFVFEDPSLHRMLTRGSYDQIYDEHAHIFSVTALKNILFQQNLEIFKVEELDVHGGSNRIFVGRLGTKKIHASVDVHLSKEKNVGMHEISTYHNFAVRVEQSKIQLIGLLKELKRKGNKIISYGATSKSTTVFNYCGITTELIDYIVDTTPSKQSKLSPGAHIPVISPDAGFNSNVDYAFLGAWNYEQEICAKEDEFLKNGRFITHVPYVRLIGEK